MPGFIGLVLAALVDYFGTQYNLYVYPGWSVYLGKLPLVHLVNIYAISVLFLYGLPSEWKKRIEYILCAATVFLALEAFAFQSGAIAYPRWELWFSYFLIIAGLSLLSFFSDFVKIPKGHQ